MTMISKSWRTGQIRITTDGQRGINGPLELTGAPSTALFPTRGHPEHYLRPCTATRRRLVIDRNIWDRKTPEQSKQLSILSSSSCPQFSCRYPQAQGANTCQL